MTFAATILTLYPEMFPGPLGHSIAGRALADDFELTVDTRAKECVRWN
jgi:tRNA (guanine37-N1)-methyltransferase